MKRVLPVCLLSGLLCCLLACGKSPLGATASIKEHGFRALAYITSPAGQTHYEFASRGTSRRFEGLPGPFPVLIVKGKEKAFQLDPKTETYREVPAESAPKELDDHPLVPGFSEKIEAARRGLTQYFRENDTIFSGNACHLWRFEDRPDDPLSPSTTYWIAPSLDRLVVRVDRETVKPDGTRIRTTTEMRNVRRGAEPSLFEIPESYKKAS